MKNISEVAYLQEEVLSTLLRQRPYSCPVSNIATHNLVNSTLRKGCNPLFKEICKNEHLLETDGVPCALFAHPEKSLLWQD